MSWFQSTGLSSFAKTALKEAQKTIDKALDIKEEEDGGGNASNRTGASGRATAAVTDMASEFFASWGVTGISSPTKDSSSINDANSSGDGASSSSSSDDTKENQNRAISTPPKRSSTVEDLLLLNLQSSESSACNGPSLTSHVPVSLFSPGTEEPKTNDQEGDNISSRGIFSKHTRSLSDTVFHASDDSNILGDLVQVLDDNSTYAATSPNDHISFIQPCIPLSPNQHNNTVNDLVTFSQPEPLIPENLIASDDNIVSSTSSAKDTGITKNEAKGNVELLQEIDLDSAGGVVSEEAPEEVNLVSDIVISTTDSQNIVESSGLSDGWDWAASTDSCLGGGTNEDAVLETEPSKDEMEASSSAELSAESSDTLVPEQETIEKQQIDDYIPSSAPPPLLSPPPSATSPKLVPSSSRPSSPLVQESGVGESTPPSSARVSPNFEMVSSGCCAASNSDAGSGGALPESSRSSSIVVVSGRESTLNSRGTSGAGSSGSSEGGHDIVMARYQSTRLIPPL